MRLHMPLALSMVVATVAVVITEAVPIKSETAAAAVPAAKALFTRGMAGYYCFRGPRLVMGKDRVVFAFANAKLGDCEDIGHTDMVYRKSADNGRTWSTLTKLPHMTSNTTDRDDFSATPVIDRGSGRIVMLVRHFEDPLVEGATATTFVTYSDDNGATWTKNTGVEGVVNDPAWRRFAIGPSHGIQLRRGAHAGRIVIPINFGSNSGPGAVLVFSDDSGVTWHRGQPYYLDGVEGVLAQEMSVFERNDGALYVMARDQNGNHTDEFSNKGFAVSTDGGQTLSDFQNVAGLKAPIVHGATLRLRSTLDGDRYNRVLFSSPSGTALRDGVKDEHQMVIRSSYTEGRTWEDVASGAIVHNGPASYSDMVEMASGEVLLAFEAGDTGQVSHHEIRYTYFTEAQLGLPDNYSDGTATVDLSGHGNTGRIHGTAHAAEGRFDMGVSLDGVDDYVQVPFAESLAIDNSEFTAMAWFKYDVNTGTRPILWAYNQGDHSQLRIVAEPELSRVSGFVQSGSSSASVASTRSHSDNNWHHVALQRQGSTLRLYIDGTLAESATAPTGSVSPGRPFRLHIGQRLDGAQNFQGMIDEVRMYKRALTEDEILRIRNTNALNVSGAILHLPFQPHLPTTADLSVNNSDGFVAGEATVGAGRYGNAMAFDGVDDRVRVQFSNATNLGSSQFTVSTWFRYPAGTTRQTLLWFYGMGEANSQLWIRADPANNQIVAWARTPIGAVDITTTKAYADNVWHFLALRRTASQLILTIDGTDVGAVAMPAGSLSGAFTERIGGLHLGEKIDQTDRLRGGLDEVHIYLRALDATELAALRTANTTPTNGLALHLPLNAIQAPR